MQRRRGTRPGVGGRGGSREQRGFGGQVRTAGPGQTEALISKQNSDKQGLGWGLREAPWWLRCQEPACNAGDLSSIPGWGRSPGERDGYTLVFLPGESHGQRSLVGYRLLWSQRVRHD